MKLFNILFFCVICIAPMGYAMNNDNQQIHKIACDTCFKKHKGLCDKLSPCRNCKRQGTECNYTRQEKRRGRPFGTLTEKSNKVIKKYINKTAKKDNKKKTFSGNTKRKGNRVCPEFI